MTITMATVITGQAVTRVLLFYRSAVYLFSPKHFFLDKSWVRCGPINTTSVCIPLLARANRVSRSRVDHETKRVVRFAAKSMRESPST